MLSLESREEGRGKADENDMESKLNLLRDEIQVGNSIDKLQNNEKRIEVRRRKMFYRNWESR